jgi:hypothetical protein
LWSAKPKTKQVCQIELSVSVIILGKWKKEIHRVTKLLVANRLDRNCKGGIIAILRKPSF